MDLNDNNSIQRSSEYGMSQSINNMSYTTIEYAINNNPCLCCNINRALVATMLIWEGKEQCRGKSFYIL